MAMATISVDGVELYYEVHGDGDPFLLVHGAASSGLWYEELIPLLAEEYRVIVPDLRGMGRSQRVAPLERPEIWVEDLLRVLDTEGVERTGIAGCSLGARVVGRLTYEHPERVDYLVVDAPIVNLSAHGNAALVNVFGNVDEDSDEAREWAYLHGDTWREAVAFYGATRSSPGFQEYYTLRPHLAELTLPTLVCRGDHDDSIHPVDDAFVWHKEAPNTELWIAPGMSQSSTMKERPDVFALVLRGFRERLTAKLAA